MLFINSLLWFKQITSDRPRGSIKQKYKPFHREFRDESLVQAGGAEHSSSLTLALFQPDIPQNCGTMLRMCACLGLAASIIEPAGFPTSDRHFRRAGLDYLDHLALERYASFAIFEAARRKEGRRLILLSTKAALPYTRIAFAPRDILLVGRESAGVPDEVHAAADARIVIPIQPPLRSLNVAVAAAIVVGEALRQLGARNQNLSGQDTKA